MVMERYWWNTSQLIFKNVQNDVCGTAVSWDFTKLGVPSDAEKVVKGEEVLTNTNCTTNSDRCQVLQKTSPVLAVVYPKVNEDLFHPEDYRYTKHNDTNEIQWV